MTPSSPLGSVKNEEPEYAAEQQDFEEQEVEEQEQEVGEQEVQAVAHEQVRACFTPSKQATKTYAYFFQDEDEDEASLAAFRDFFENFVEEPAEPVVPRRRILQERLQQAAADRANLERDLVEKDQRIARTEALLHRLLRERDSDQAELVSLTECIRADQARLDQL